MKDLIARLEAATEGSRELDAEILAAIGTYVLERRDNDRKEWWYPVDGPKYHRLAADSPPKFSRSIDAPEFAAKNYPTEPYNIRLNA